MGSEGQAKFVDRPLVYVAGPYSRPDPVENTHRTIRIASELCAEGLVTPVVPHLTMLWHAVEPHPLEHWYEYDLAVLARCDALLRLEGASTGADAEVEFARAREIPVFASREDLAVWARRDRP
jgi:nucleoside 2-deoxyribosyltransferase